MERAGLIFNLAVLCTAIVLGVSCAQKPGPSVKAKNPQIERRPNSDQVLALGQSQRLTREFCAYEWPVQGDGPRYIGKACPGDQVKVVSQRVLYQRTYCQVEIIGSQLGRRWAHLSPCAEE